VSTFVEPNLHFRDYMEDRYVCIDPFMPGEIGGERWAFFAVYDGHGGTEAAVYLEQQFHEIVAAELRAHFKEQRRQKSTSDKAIADAFSRAFCRVDDQLRTIGAHNFGSTATIALVQKLASGVKIHTANVGDSRAIAIDGEGSYNRLTQDHRAIDPAEVLRVQQAGGFVSRGRVSGVLAVSRALGDHSMKRSGVTWRPYTNVRDATGDFALAIASDGLWDFLDDREAKARITQSRIDGTSEHVAQKLVEDAQRRGSTDNITCVVVFLS
jgi:serine/threonine protein phosphatase PrpC